MKNKSIKNKIFASALALTLTIGAFQLPSYVSNTAEKKAPELKIKKVLNLPKEGVATPAETFKFQFEKHSFNGKEDDTSKQKLPDIQEKSADFTNNMATDADSTKEGKQIVKLTDDVLNGIQFNEPGQYTYRVKEKAGSTTDMTYSQAVYLVSIFTKTDETGKVKVDTIQIKKEKSDDGQQKQEGKTEYKPGTDTEGKGNNFEFNNNYDPKAGNDTPTGKDIGEKDKKGFVLRKEVAGTNGNVNEKFKFNITANKPDGSHSTETTFKYKVVLSNGTAEAEKEATYNKPFDVELKHGERVVFSKVLLGSTVKAEETVDFGYQKSIKDESKINGVTPTVDDLKTGLVIGDNASGNFVNFVNTQQTATGILMNNLPFIALVLAAGVGIFFFVKNKKEDENTQA